MAIRCTRVPRLIMPKAGTDLSRWAVVACDQYTSQPDYWNETDRIVGDAPSTLRLTLPEVYLEQADCAERISAIQKNMKDYFSSGVLEELRPGVMLLERKTGGACPRRGIVLAFDLEAYTYTEGSDSLIRPTEKTVVERIPPRLKVRKGACLELPHIMLLIDDPERKVIEPLFAEKDRFETAYDVELMQNGGHLTGWFVPEGKETDELLKRFDMLADREVFNHKYGLTEDKPLLPFAVGDGNHSMATAKAYWEQLKPTLSPEEQENHPARFVLAEVVNVHDESILIEGIYRVLFGADAVDLFEAAHSFFLSHGANVTVAESEPHTLAENVQSFQFRAGHRTGCLLVENSPWALPVATLQAFLDDYLANHASVKIDYIHGTDVLDQLAGQEGNIGFLLPDPAKEDLFRGVIFDGVLPRKTFSMGEAREKRYYMEAKRITL